MKIEFVNTFYTCMKISSNKKLQTITDNNDLHFLFSNFCIFFLLKLTHQLRIKKLGNFSQWKLASLDLCSVGDPIIQFLSKHSHTHRGLLLFTNTQP